MAGGFNAAAFGTGLLGAVNNNMAQEADEQRKKEDYTAKLAADNAAEAQKQTTQDQHDATQMHSQAESLANMAMDGYGGEVLPGQILKSYNAINVYGTDKIASMNDDARQGVYKYIRNKGEEANNQIAQGSGTGITPSAYGYTTPSQAPVSTTVPGQINPMAVPASALQPPASVAAALPANPWEYKVYKDPDTGQPLRNEAFLATLPSNRQDLIRGMSDGLYPIPTPSAVVRDKTGKMEAELTQLHQYDDTAGVNRIPGMRSLQSGKIGGQTQLINQTVGHLGTMYDAATALTQQDIPLLNKIANAAGVKIGESPTTTYNLIMQRVAQETTKLYRNGTASVQEAEQTEKNMSSDMSPAQIKGVVEAQLHLLKSTVGSVDNQSKIIMGRAYSPMSFLSKESTYTLARMGHGDLMNDTTAPSPNDAAAPSPQTQQGQPQTAQPANAGPNPQMQDQQPSAAQPQQGQQQAPPIVHVTSQQDIDSAPVGAQIFVNGKLMGTKQAPKPAAPHPTQDQSIPANGT